MNYTFQRVAAHCGLRLSYYCTAIFLSAVFLVLCFTDYRSASPLYILLTLAVLPSVCKSIFFSGDNKEKDSSLEFPLFCQKYHYNSNSYKATNLAYFLLFILFAAWHLSSCINQTLPAFVAMLPILTASSCLIIRILGTIGYRLYFHFFPLKAMH